MSSVESNERIEQLERWRDDMERRFATAFPAADYDGHRRYHQLMIENIEWKKRIYRALVERTVLGLVWGVGLFIGAAVLHYVVAYFKAAG